MTIVVLPAKAEPIAQYAAEELVWHVAQATAANRAAALDRLIAYRRNVERLGLANLDRRAQIETESWKDVPGFTAPASMPKATPAGKAGGG